MRLPPIRPLIYLITDGTAIPGNRSSHGTLVDRLVDAASAGVDLIQIRVKQLSTKELYELTRTAVQALGETDVRLLVNGRADVAAAAGADGVHLPGDGLPAGEIRRAFPELIVGVSTHSIEEIRAAKQDGADFAVFGPVFATPGKGEGVGAERLSEAVAAADAFPIIALGGIDESNYDAALNRGPAGFAAIRALSDPSWIRGIERRYDKR
jgi:thiamine-phosphate pyrophosphorylase